MCLLLLTPVNLHYSHKPAPPSSALDYMKCKHSLQIGQLNRVFGVNKGFTGFYLGSNAVPNNTRLISRADNGAVSPGSVSPGFLFETG